MKLFAKALWKLVVNIFNPSPFKVGIAVTTVVTALAFEYYTAFDPDIWIFARLEELHQKTIDIRMRDRGPRTPSPDVAIIAVDELAEEKIGRWPWPRGKIAEIIDLLVSYGVKVVAFDAVFVEPDKNQATLSLTKLKESSAGSGELQELIDQELLKANTDWLLSKTVEKQSDHLVMGSYYDERTDRYYPYQELCGNLILESSSWYPQLQNEEKPVIAMDDNPTVVPDLFRSILTKNIEQIEAKVRSDWGDKNPDELPTAINDAKTQYCDRWLVKSGDSIDEFFESSAQMWELGKGEIEGWSHLTYSDAADTLRQNTLNNQIHRTGRWWLNLPIIAAGTKHTAYFNAFLDSDGTLRRSGLVVRHGDTYMSSMALKSVLVANDWNVKVYLNQDPRHNTTKAISKMTLIDSEGSDIRNIPVDGRGRLMINYAGDEKTFPHISIYELFNKSDLANISIRRGNQVVKESVNKAEFFKNKILIFGATSTGTYDLRVTPFSENYPGVETHANLVDNLLTQSFLISHPEEGPYMVLVLAILGLILAYGIAHLGAVQGLIVTILAMTATYLVDHYYLFASGMTVTTVLPIFLVGFMYVTMTFYKYLTEERKKKAIKGTFEKYVSPAIVAEVLKHPDNVELGGKKQRMTVVFSDLRGFTTISEKLDPQVLVMVLNKYLTPMTALVFKNQGTLDKYMGDAIMSFFGAPIHYADHAKKACQCAIEMIDLLPVINEDFKAQGLPQIDVGIGVNTGDMSVGNMGSETVRNFTVMGDAVNLGSRLEGINKQYGTRIIISEYTYEEVKDEYVAREVDWVRVKGKMQPVKIFELINHKSKFKNYEMLEHFQKGFLAYHERKWDEAQTCFSQALSINPNDNPSKLYLERLEEYKEVPPPDNWDGVYEMKTK